MKPNRVILMAMLVLMILSTVMFAAQSAPKSDNPAAKKDSKTMDCCAGKDGKMCPRMKGAKADGKMDHSKMAEGKMDCCGGKMDCCKDGKCCGDMAKKDGKTADAKMDCCGGKCDRMNHDKQGQ